MQTEYMNLPQLLSNDSGVVILAMELGIASNSFKGKVLIGNNLHRAGEHIVLQAGGYKLYNRKVIMEDGTQLENKPFDLVES